MEAALKNESQQLTARDVTKALRSEPHRWLDVGHSRLAAWTFGNGPHVVFVHGWPLHSATFRAVVPYLASQYTCHLIDLPAAGKSSYTQQTPFAITDHAKSMLRAVDLLGVERYALVAQDSGAAIARWMAVGNPNVTALIMANTEIPGHHGAFIEISRRLAKSGWGRAFLRRFLRNARVRRSNLSLRGCFTNPDFADGEFGNLFATPLLGDPNVFEAQMKLLANFNPREIDEFKTRHKEITAPVLMVWGAKDQFFPVEKARAMTKQFGGPVEFIEVPGGKLLHYEEYPGKFAELTRIHLERCLN